MRPAPDKFAESIVVADLIDFGYKALSPEMNQAVTQMILCVRVISAALMILLLFGCNRNVTPGRAGEFFGITVSCGSSDGPHTLFLNGEPIDWNSEYNTVLVSGFPLKAGSNQLRAVFEFPPLGTKTKGEKITGFRGVIFTVKTKVSGQWQEITNIVEHGHFVGTNEYDADFTINAGSLQGGIPFEPLGNNKQQFEDRTRDLAVKLSQVIKEGNGPRLIKVFSPADDVSMFVGAGWLSGPHSNNISLRSVTNSSQVVAQAGQYLILVRPATNNGTLFTSTLTISEYESAGTAYDSFVFARKEGQWGLLGGTRKNGKWERLDLSELGYKEK